MQFILTRTVQFIVSLCNLFSHYAIYRIQYNLLSDMQFVSQILLLDTNLFLL